MRTCNINVDPWFKRRKQREKNPWYRLLALTVTSYLMYKYTCYSCYTFYACQLHLLRLLYACYDTLAALSTVHLIYLLSLLRMLGTLLALGMLNRLATLFEVATPATFNRWYQQTTLSETFCLMRNPIYFFILSKLVQFSILCKKPINQDFDQPIRTPLQRGIPRLQASVL